MTYEVITVDGHEAIKCLLCGAVSHNANDVAKTYCGKCHRFHDEGFPSPVIRDLPDDDVSSEESFKELSEKMERLFDRLRRDRPSRKVAKQNFFLREHAIEIGELARDVEYWIVENPMCDEARRMRAREAAGDLPPGFCDSVPHTMSMEGALNGYVAFPKRRAPLTERSLSDGPRLIDYLPVHGGVTYAVKDACACVYGFDTCHFNSDPLPRTDRAWIAWQCRVLYESILAAAKIDRAYHRARTNQERAKIVQPLVDLVPEEDLGTSAMLNLLGGRL